MDYNPIATGCAPVHWASLQAPRPECAIQPQGTRRRLICALSTWSWLPEPGERCQMHLPSPSPQMGAFGIARRGVPSSAGRPGGVLVRPEYLSGRRWPIAVVSVTSRASGAKMEMPYVRCRA